MQPKIAELKAVVDWIGSRGWCPATAGNFSGRLDEQHCIVTASGVDKTALREEDFLLVDLNGKVCSGEKKPSAETFLHTTLYGLDRQIGAVLHTHSVPATVLSKYYRDKDAVDFHGYEMQKALMGIPSHEDRVNLTIFDNDQNIPSLADRLRESWQKQPLNYGFLIRGHGLYAWGQNIAEAKRHLEGLEFLLSCELNRLLLEARL
jgi:methylthioribulose-1-phosphate dehydratase